MNKNTKIGISVIVIILIIIAGLAFYQSKQTQKMISDITKKLTISTETNTTPTPKPTTEPINQVTEAPSNIAKDPQNATYNIDGQNVTLTNGKATNGNVTTTMFGEPTVGDLNEDGANDAGVILVVSGAGSGTFYYSAAAINNTSSFIYEGTNAIILGDRISPQSKNIQNQIYTINYADRAPGEPMSTQPSVGVSKYFKLNGNTLVETNDQ